MKKWLRNGLIILLVLLCACGIMYLYYWTPKADITLSKETSFPLTTQQKLQDFNYLYEVVEAGFPYFEVKKRQFGIDWLSRRAIFEAQIKATTCDLEYYNTLKQILSQMQNGHTNIIEPGSSYEKYTRLYKGSGPWNHVINHPIVTERYAHWKDLVQENTLRCLPVLFQYIEGRYVVVDGYAGGCLAEQNLPVGSVLETVDGVAADDYVNSLQTQRVLSIDRNRNKPMLIHLVIYAKEDTLLEIIHPDGHRESLSISPVDYIGSIIEEDEPEHLYSTEILRDNEVAYIKIPSFSGFYVEKDREGILQFFEEVKHYKSLIIDIRGNGGGSTNYWMNNLVAPLTKEKLQSNAYYLFRNSEYIKPFVRRKMIFGIHGFKPIESLPVAKERPEYFQNNDGVYSRIQSNITPKNPIGFNGHIYLLVDKHVFSSAEAFAVFAKATGWATLVGTDTGGDGIGFDPVIFALPHSGLVVRFPSEMGVTPNGYPNEETATSPDIYVEPLYQDYLKMVDMKNANEPVESLERRLQYDTILSKTLKLITE